MSDITVFNQRLASMTTRSYILAMKTILFGSMLLLAVSLFSPSVQGHSVDVWIDSLDKPTRTEIVDLGPSSTNPPGSQRLRVKLSCFSYSTFMVKELYEEVNKGMSSEIIVPLSKSALPDCTQSSALGEMPLGKPDWEGDRFAGAKGNLLFFEWVDGNGGRPFSVLDATRGKKVFSDVAYHPWSWRKKLGLHSFDRLHIIQAQNGSVTLKYLRVETYDCDLHLPTDREACWEKIKMQAGLGDRQLPVCSGYERIEWRYESAVAYPVEVSLGPRPTRRTITGPVRCWPSD